MAKSPPKTRVSIGTGATKTVAQSVLMPDGKTQIGGIEGLMPGKDKPTLPDVKRRQGAAEALMSGERRLNREIAFYFMPRDADWNITTTSQGRNNAEGLLDNTGVDAINRLVDNGMSLLMPLESEWFSLVMTSALEEFLGETDDKLRFEGELDRYGGIVRQFLERGEFRKAMRSAMTNFLIYGWAAVMPRIAMDGEGVVFEVFANNTVALEYSPSVKGGLFWKHKTSVRAWNRQHPYAPLKGGDDQEKMIVHACVPIGLDWLTIVYEDGGEHILYGSWHYHCPVVVGKMAAPAGHTYPRGLGADNLTEVQLLNETRFRALKLLLLKTTPMFIMNSALNLDNFQFRPGGGALVDTDIGNNVANAIAPVPVGGDSNYTVLAQEEMRQNVRSNMALMAKAPLESKGFRTAFEYELALAKEQEGVGEKLDAFRVEVIMPCIRQTIMLLHAMETPPIPAGLQVDGKFYDIKVEGTQERARKLKDAQSILNFIEVLQYFPPEVAGAKVDFDDALRRIMENLDMAELVLSQEQADAFRAQYAAAQEQMAAAMANQQGAAA